MNQPMKEQLEKVYGKPQRRKPKKRRRERLTESDIKSLMGVDKPIFRKYRGSYRQR